MVQPRIQVRTSAVKKKCKGSSLLRTPRWGVLDKPIWHLDNLSREVCYLPGALIQDIRKKLPDMIKPEDYSPLLVFQAGSPADQEGQEYIGQQTDWADNRALN